MNVFWFIAALQAAFIGSILIGGRVRIRGRILAERHIEPTRFWFYVAGFTAGLVLVMAEAVHPPY